MIDEPASLPGAEGEDPAIDASPKYPARADVASLRECAGVEGAPAVPATQKTATG